MERLFLFPFQNEWRSSQSFHAKIKKSQLQEMKIRAVELTWLLHSLYHCRKQCTKKILWTHLKTSKQLIRVSHLKEKRAMRSRRKERRTSPPQLYSCCSTDRESNILTMGVCGSQRQPQLASNLSDSVCARTCLDTHQVEWEHLFALRAQSHLQHLLGQSTQHQ